MAGNQNSGGMRPTAPQNNPANVSATGGNGQSGRQGTMYIPGMNQMGSSGVETMAQQSGASMYKAPSPSASAPGMGLPNVAQLTDPTALPNQDVMDGSPIGPGANSIEGLPMQVSEDPDINEIRAYYPVLKFYASQPGSSQGTKDYVTYLGTII
jgi:hypothetical protein